MLNGTAAPSFFSCSPPAVCDTPVAVNTMYGEAPPGRQWDGDSLIQTIFSATSSISLSVMDYIPGTIYKLNFDQVYWPGLTDALLAKLRQGVHVRMLLSLWAHSKSPQWKYAHAMIATAASCLAGHGHYDGICKGTLEIRAFEVPGWNLTEGSEASFPPYSRVNHAKYIVTDQRFNIGTSNMVWSYYHNTAGASFNSNHSGLRSQLQSAFDRDWNSPYATTVLPDAGGQATVV